MAESRWLFGSLLLLITVSVFADHQSGLTLPEVISKVQQAEGGAQSLECQFRERIERHGLAPQEIAGELRYRRPHHLRVDQRSPEKQVVVSDGTKVRVYTPAAGQVMVGAWQDWVSRTGFPAPLLSFVNEMPADQWSDRYDILFGGYDQQTYQLIFRPKSTSDMPLELWISDESFLPSRGRMRSPNAVFDVSFEGLRVNSDISGDVFNLKVPKGIVEVPLPS